MSYAAAVDHLHALGQELAPSAPRRKFDLEHMRILARALGDPHKRFPAILIAGTNGKGSTAATLASILAAAGYRTGLYTSPHLSRVTERIRTSQSCHSDPERSEGEESPHFARGASTFQGLPEPRISFTEISEEAFARLYFQVDDAALQLISAGQLPHHPSFFESLTALAFLYFAEQDLDIAILEVGLGGRLDATNIVEPILSVITDIALDHQEYLGNTISEIAREKAGILRLNGTLITLPQHPEANQAIGEAAIALNVRGINAADYLPALRINSGLQPAVSHPDEKGALAPGSAFVAPLAPEVIPPSTPLTPNHYDLILNNELLHVRSPLAGQHQQRNIALAIATAIELRNHPLSYVILSDAKNPRILPAAPQLLSSNQASYNLPPSNREPRTSNLIPNSAIEAGIANTAWPGRLEFLPPNILLDVAHNPAGAWTLRAAIATLPEDQPRTLIFSCLRDKDLTEMAQILFPLFDSAIPPRPSSHNTPLSSSDNAPLSSGGHSPMVCHSRRESASPSNPEPRTSNPVHHLVLALIDNPRAASLDDLLAAAQALDIPAHPAHDPVEALAIARSLTPASGMIIATGSIYLIGALREAVLA